MSTESQDFHREIMNEIKEINKKLDPIYTAYMGWQTVGRWGKYFLYAAGAILGIAVAVKQLFKD